MVLFSYIVVFVCTWWLLFYMMLPIGVSHAVDPDVKGQETGAPVHPYLWAKMGATTLIASLMTWLIQRLMPFLFDYLRNSS